MARETVGKRVYCKDAKFIQNTNRSSLQKRVSQALASKRTVGARKRPDPLNKNYVQAIIYSHEQNGMQFGIFAGYEKGTHQLTVADDDDAETLTVEKVAPPARKDAKRSEFLDGICFFGIFNNHVMVLGSRALRVRDLEQYLNWLMVQAGAMGAEDAMALSDQITTATKKKIQKSHVQEVSIGGPLLRVLEADEEPQNQLVEQKDRRFDLTSMGIGVLRSILGEERFQALKLTDALDGNINVSLKVRYNRNTTKAGHKLLDNIALAARNIDEGDVKLQLMGGGTVSGAELKLSKIISIETRDGIPNADDVFFRMAEWLRALLADEIIES
jgi:hypothetical protein